MTIIIDPQPWPELQTLLPLHSSSELKAIRASIRDHDVVKNGVYWTDEEGNQWIIDHTHVSEFAKIYGKKMEWRHCGISSDKKEEALAFGVALSTAHRNISSEQLKDMQQFLRAQKMLQRKTALKLRAQGKTQEEAAAIVGVDNSTISKWESGISNLNFQDTYIPEPPDLRVSISKSEYEKIYVRHLKGETQTEIAADYKVTQSTISNIISKERSRLSAKPNEEEEETGGELGLFEGLGYSPKPYDVWNFKIDRQYGVKHPGNIPAGIIFNLLYFYTKSGDLVIDPMAGGGVVGDVCHMINRKCLMYDLKPARDDIREHDLTTGWPVGAEKAELVFLDPPYYKKLENQYGPNSISVLSREKYLDFFFILSEKIYDSGANCLALLMSDYTDDEDSSQHIFIWDYWKRFCLESKKWVAERHIMVPLSTQQVHPDFIKKFRKSKKLARLGRSLVIFRRDKN